ncbi:FAD-dependent oxidoreductase [Mesorhizobium sp. M4A.F.Ca.ET.020.02.1.1]|uniref:D-amino acid dehydrogenase n=4 Tax=Mesorhizobium TaxID=68287 RepID=UPI000F754D53|nr:MULTISPECIES: D-amino acid dehydrogenase [unclassified Mesorhizobium]AZO49850.1 FAD-dependent oxidoreductase [Mesorhizobium sp. M4B.F.Ca.ET.058.02.1.1]RUX49533.1 FAD-dependent oxidoreductase [Mesorhizobium sp. M4A.F.Ca.ET.050.02.1.1]RVC44180.1 FAD-dependent oxidoreductase [Mesorhizobium sp. M4A.F.Ca.ET.090.04.2.1]RVD40120.1 FAD-dependent oxidoreductase [Mesorhizobium sp. M4A.F.Ca.ET.020.02.1.1]RWD21770.1 MAG: FAD-dependent oxidoreductase [Mesorhizobium sp.]
MRVIVLGGGVVGVTTAYQLQKDGHEVALIERQPQVAAETSWGNAGMIAPGHSFVWSSPKAPMILLKSLVLKDQALRFRMSADPRLYSWSWRFLMECTAEKARRNTLLKHRLAAYSQSVLREVIADEAIDYDRNDRGILYFHRSQQALDKGVEHMKLLESDGQEIRLLDREGVVALDPSLASARGKIAGGIYCPTDETGDPAKFTRALAAKIAGRGGEIRTGTTITGIETSGDGVAQVRTDKGVFKGDAYVLALGSYSPLIAKAVGISLPIYPIKGYSLTIPIGNRPQPPTIASVDEHNLVAISRFGDRLRVTATAEFAGYDTGHRPADFAFMKGVTEELYPEGADYDRAEMWAGLRPMTPNNLPEFGQQRLRNLYLNTGHGHIGWTMSHGSARITADLIGGRRPAISMDGLLN